MTTFNTIPSAVRVPFVAVEFDASRAQLGSGDQPYTALIIGQKLTGGSALANTAVRVTDVGQAQALFGRGSMLHRQFLAFFTANRFTEVWAGVVADDAAGAAATGTIALAGTATNTATLSLYLGGVRVPVGVPVGMTAAQAATAAAAAINANLDLPVTATAATSTVTVTHRHKGEVGNGYDIRVNYQDGELLPLGLTPTITAMAGGTTNPTLTALIAALGDHWFNVIAMDYSDATSLSALESELDDRNSGLRMIDGVAFVAKSATVSALGTLGNSRNSDNLSIVSTHRSPTPSSEVGAAVAGVVSYYAPIDPARPFQTLPVPGVVAPAEADRNTFAEHNTLLYDGISTLKVVGGQVQLERLVTTYQRNATGSPSTAYLDVTTKFTLSFLRFDFRRIISGTFPRHKLAPDGVRYGPGQFVVTPSLGLAMAISIFRQWEARGLVTNFDQFKAEVRCEISLSDPNRLEWSLPADLMNQLIFAVAQIQFLQ